MLIDSSAVQIVTQKRLSLMNILLQIDTAVLKTLKKLNIDHYKGYYLHDWKLCKNNQVESAIFHSTNRKISIKCLAMFPYEKKLVSEVTFKGEIVRLILKIFLYIFFYLAV